MEISFRQPTDGQTQYYRGIKLHVDGTHLMTQDHVDELFYQRKVLVDFYIDTLRRIWP